MARHRAAITDRLRFTGLQFARCGHWKTFHSRHSLCQAATTVEGYSDLVLQICVAPFAAPIAHRVRPVAPETFGSQWCQRHLADKRSLPPEVDLCPLLTRRQGLVCPEITVDDAMSDEGQSKSLAVWIRESLFRQFDVHQENKDLLKPWA